VSNFILTLVALFAGGVKRISHLANISDIGFGLFTGVIRTLTPAAVLNLSLSVDKDKIHKFVKATGENPVDKDNEGVHTNISVDEHVIPEWTEDIKREKTRVPTRGRVMKAIKAIYSFNLDTQRFISLKVKGGKSTLSTVLPEIISELKSKVTGKIRLFFDRGGYKGTLFKDLIEDEGLSFVTLAKGYSKSKEQWDKIPDSEFKPLEKLPLVSKKFNKGNWYYKDTETKIGNCPYPIRSIVLKDKKAKDEKKKYRVIFTDDNKTHPVCLINQYSVHWRHENGYKVLKNDLYIDNMPKGYVIKKNTGNKTVVNRPERTLLLGWLKGLTFNLIKDFSNNLGDKYKNSTAGTIIRLFLRRPGYIRVESGNLIVSLLPFKHQDVLVPYIENINQQNIRIPWLGDLILHFELGNITSFHCGNINKFKKLVKRSNCARKHSV